MTSKSALEITAENFIGAAKQLRASIGADIPIQQVMIMVYLLGRDSANQTELVRQLGIKKAASSRHCRSLSSFTVQRDGQPLEKGQRLIVAAKSNTSGREMTYRLTDDSVKIITNFITALTGSNY